MSIEEIDNFASWSDDLTLTFYSDNNFATSVKGYKIQVINLSDFFQFLFKARSENLFYKVIFFVSYN